MNETLERIRERHHEVKSQWHREQAALPVKEKVRILLELQKQDLPIIAQRRPLKWWEKPWDIEP